MTTFPRVGDCRSIALPYHDDPGGSLTVLEQTTEIPFDVRRAFLITGVPAGGTRGCRANVRASELFVCASGAVTLRVEDDRSSRSIPLSARSGALLVPPMLWVELLSFVPGTVVIVLANSGDRDADREYIRNRGEWLAARDVAHVA
jgi:hypothetical protein